MTFLQLRSDFKYVLQYYDLDIILILNSENTFYASSSIGEFICILDTRKNFLLHINGKNIEKINMLDLITKLVVR